MELSPKEYDVLRIMVQHAGKVLTHNFILDQVWGAMSDVQYLRIYVRQLHHKLEDISDKPYYILTEIGVGCLLREPEIFDTD